jgi:hypothetical protein
LDFNGSSSGTSPRSRALKVFSMNRRRIADAVAPVIDLALVVFVVPAALLLKFVRWVGLSRLGIIRAVLKRIGLLPVRNHYYEPFVIENDLFRPLNRQRNLPGIDLNVQGQLSFLSTLTFENELKDLDSPLAGPHDFRFGNGLFESGDAEYLYQVIRRLRPTSVFEIGSGNSTKMALAAIRRNASEDAGLECRHVCIEPYSAPWLENSGVKVLRERVEDIDVSLFRELGRNDLLFIDSSHVIRPQGDVITEYLEILPILRPGVVVHIHDVFTPRDYLDKWVFESMLLWDEQYLMEAFLSNNANWKIIGALNFLKHEHFDALKRACPYMSLAREPGSFYIERT